MLPESILKQRLSVNISNWKHTSILKGQYFFCPSIYWLNLSSVSNTETQTSLLWCCAAFHLSHAFAWAVIVVLSTNYLVMFRFIWNQLDEFMLNSRVSWKSYWVDGVFQVLNRTSWWRANIGWESWLCSTVIWKHWVPVLFKYTCWFIRQTFRVNILERELFCATFSHTNCMLK